MGEMAPLRTAAAASSRELKGAALRRAGVTGSVLCLGVGIGAVHVVGDVLDCCNLGHGFQDHALDALSECDARHAAALAAAAHLHERNIVLHVDECDLPAVRGYARIDALLQHQPDTLGKLACGCGWPGRRAGG